MDICAIDNVVSVNGRDVEVLRLKTKILSLFPNIVSEYHGGFSFPLSCLDALIERIPDIPKKLVSLFQDSVFYSHKKARLKALLSYQERDTSNIDHFWCGVLDLPQQYAVSAMTTEELLGLCLFDEQGSGKTVMTIAAFDILCEHESCDSLIVVCPKSMMNSWKQDIERFLGAKYKITLLDGSLDQKILNLFTESQVVIVNFETVGTISNTLKALAETHNTLLAVDESYFVKNEKAHRSKSILALRSKCKRCFVLCGTPAPHGPEDLVNQFNLADLGYTFSTCDLNFGKANNGEILQHCIKQRGTMIRRLKIDVIENVPTKKFEIIPVVFDGRQACLYNNACKSTILWLQSYDGNRFKKDLKSYFRKRETLLQICAIPHKVDPTFEGCSAKLAVLDKVLHELFAQKRKVIVWASYKEAIDDIYARFKSCNPLVIDGRTNTQERSVAVAKFQNDPNALLLIANPAAAGVGITLHAAHDAVYYSFTNNAAHFIQSLDRIHRRGQTSNTVHYYLLVCSDTIEEKTVKRLRELEIQQTGVLGDKYLPSSLDEALAELQH